MILPPPDHKLLRLPRDVIFVIDTSGSMSGESIRQARQALSMAVKALQPNDRFNIIKFSASTDSLFRTLKASSQAAKDEAQSYIAALEARGGTNMAPALRLALQGESEPTRVRQVVFLTDGAVGNDPELLQMVADQLGDNRLFTVGIGSAPNSYFMTKAARLGRGTFTYIGKVGEVRERMQALFEKLEAPVMRDITVQ